MSNISNPNNSPSPNRPSRAVPDHLRRTSIAQNEPDVVGSTTNGGTSSTPPRRTNAHPSRRECTSVLQAQSCHSTQLNDYSKATNSEHTQAHPAVSIQQPSIRPSHLSRRHIKSCTSRDVCRLYWSCRRRVEEGVWSFDGHKYYKGCIGWLRGVRGKRKGWASS